MTLLHLILVLLAATTRATDNDLKNKHSPVVDLGYVKYRGAYHNDTDTNQFHGIYYAQPPLGELRWRRPLPIEEKNNYGGKVVDVSNFGPNCPQAPVPSITTSTESALSNGSEDCLLLDVYVPAHPVSTALPVMVNLHGGGYAIGGAAAFPGDSIVHNSKGQMIYVVAQYRLGMFGFLAGSEIRENGEANAGLFDQRTALRWVQRHISAFGGDPSRVTIYGASAGGGSVLYQLIANSGADVPPFSAAISEMPWMQPLMNLSSQNIQYRHILGLTGCSNLTCLRSLDSDTLIKVGEQDTAVSFPSPGYGQGTFNYGPTVDGSFIRQLPSEEFKQGHFQKVPFLTDHDEYEGLLFTNPNVTTQAEETLDAHYVFPFGGPAFFARLYQAYPRSNFNSTFFQRQTWFGDAVVACPTYYAATAFTDHAGNSSAVFKLVFDAGTQVHGATVPFIFPGSAGLPPPNNNTLAEIMTNYFISFVVTWDPNPLRSPIAPFWSSYLDTGAASVNGSGQFNIMSVTYNSVEITPDPDASPRCDFLYAQNHVVSN